MSETTSACRCGRPTRDAAYVCDTCTGRLNEALNECPWLDDELEVTITRQRSAAIEGGRGSSERGLPWHDKASEARRLLHGLLSTWVRFCDEEGVRGLPNRLPRDNITSMSRWMLHLTHGLSLHDIGNEAVDELTDAIAECQRLVFWKRSARIYLGTCEQRVEDEDGELIRESCPGEVYADEDAPVATCDECGQGMTVVIRKAVIDKRLEDQLCTAADIATYAVYLGMPAPREQVRKRVHYWHRHGRLLNHGTNVAGDPVFRYGEVRTMLFKEFGRDSA